MQQCVNDPGQSKVNLVHEKKKDAIKNEEIRKIVQERTASSDVFTDSADMQDEREAVTPKELSHAEGEK